VIKKKGSLYHGHEEIVKILVLNEFSEEDKTKLTDFLINQHFDFENISIPFL